MVAGVIPAPFVITDNDKRGLIVVSVSISLAFVWVCLLVRTWLRCQTREWRSDDFLLAAATVCLSLHTRPPPTNITLTAPQLLDTAQSVVILHMVGMGLGAPKDDIPLLRLQQLGKVRRLLALRFRLLPQGLQPWSTPLHSTLLYPTPAHDLHD
jgi:hypothetical protein